MGFGNLGSVDHECNHDKNYAQAMLTWPVNSHANERLA